MPSICSQEAGAGRSLRVHEQHGLRSMLESVSGQLELYSETLPQQNKTTARRKTKKQNQNQHKTDLS